MTYLKTVWNKKEDGRKARRSPAPRMVAKQRRAGSAFAVDDWTRLARFLVLGKLNAARTTRPSGRCRWRTPRRSSAASGWMVRASCAKIVAVSEAGRAPKNDPALFALAMCSSFWRRQDAASKRWRLCRLVARIGTHLFHFAAVCGWNARDGDAACGWQLETGTRPDARRKAGVSGRSSTASATAGATGTCCACPTRSRSRTSIWALYHWITQGWESCRRACRTRMQPCGWSGRRSGRRRRSRRRR